MRKCEFYLELDQMGGGAELPEGFHFEGDNQRICPRGLEGEGANPYGDCPLYNVEKCMRALEEELNCPARRSRTERRIDGLFGEDKF